MKFSNQKICKLSKKFLSFFESEIRFKKIVCNNIDIKSPRTRLNAIKYLSAFKVTHIICDILKCQELFLTEQSKTDNIASPGSKLALIIQ